MTKRHLAYSSTFALLSCLNPLVFFSLLPFILKDFLITHYGDKSKVLSLFGSSISLLLTGYFLEPKIIIDFVLVILICDKNFVFNRYKGAIFILPICFVLSHLIYENYEFGKSIFVLLAIILLVNYKNSVWSLHVQKIQLELWVLGLLYMLDENIIALVVLSAQAILHARNISKWTYIRICFIPIISAIITVMFQFKTDTIPLLLLYIAANSYWLIEFIQTMDSDKSDVFLIAGDSGVGKDRLADRLIDIFQQNQRPLKLSGDSFHKWERKSENWENKTHLDPMSNDLFMQQRVLRTLTLGDDCDHNIYNHSSGSFETHRSIGYNKCTLLVGLHSFYFIQERTNVDNLKIYIEIDEELRRHLKIKRDVGERGRTLEYTMKSIEDRRNDFSKYVLPQREMGDIVFSVRRRQGSDPSLVTFDQMELKVRSNIFIDAEYLAMLFEKHGLSTPSYEVSPTSLELIFNKEITSADVHKVLQNYSDMPMLNEAISDGKDYTNIMVLVIILSFRSVKQNLL